jgi:hypothetical protein
MPQARAQPEQVEADTVAGLLKLVAELQADNDRLRAGRPAAPPPPEWMTIKEAAFRASISSERMRQLVHLKRVVSRREGGSIFVNVASLDERLRRVGRR